MDRTSSRLDRIGWYKRKWGFWPVPDPLAHRLAVWMDPASAGPLVLCVLAVYGLGRVVPGTDLLSVSVSLGLYLVVLAPLAPALWADLRRLR